MHNTKQTLCCAGNKIARRLAEAGCTVAAWNRDPSKSSPLSDAGIEVHESAQQAVQASDVVLLMLSDAAAIQDVLLNPSKPVDLMHKVVIQMGTIGQLQLVLPTSVLHLSWEKG